MADLVVKKERDVHKNLFLKFLSKSFVSLKKGFIFAPAYRNRVSDVHKKGNGFKIRQGSIPFPGRSF